MLVLLQATRPPGCTGRKYDAEVDELAFSHTTLFGPQIQQHGGCPTHRTPPTCPCASKLHHSLQPRRLQCPSRKWALNSGVIVVDPVPNEDDRLPPLHHTLRLGRNSRDT